VITVPEVRMSPDLKLATAYIVPLGGKDEKAVVTALDSHKRFLRHEVARRINLKFAPDLRFRLDDTFDEAARIDTLLRSPEVARDLAPAPNRDSDDER
jgi:ribosome-binding factor A